MMGERPGTEETFWAIFLTLVVSYVACRVLHCFHSKQNNKERVTRNHYNLQTMKNKTIVNKALPYQICSQMTNGSLFI